VVRRSSTEDDVKATAARRAGFPVALFGGFEAYAGVGAGEDDCGVSIGARGGAAGGDGVIHPQGCAENPSNFLTQ
jgi:hypothetical protein